ncbi:hypothetical protein BC628DRAFT_1415460 [Trametes gibbosa]|nr:hypothetical protein BC628DRAFT_1415460 [Trametes gibbosa]
MGPDEDWSGSGDDLDQYETSRRSKRPTKRRKLEQRGPAKKGQSKAASNPETPEGRIRPFSFDPLLVVLRQQSTVELEDDEDSSDSFEAIIGPLLPEYEQIEKTFLHSTERLDEMVSSYERHGTLTPLATPRVGSNINPQVLDALYAIRTTPYNNSFLSRLKGAIIYEQTGVIAVDWETRTPWMDLMSDIREHYSLAHPERDQPVEVTAPITYCSLQSRHLHEVHDLLARVFWEGVDVSDSLDHSPEKCTVVATYKKLVVGAAFLSSPQETYITYLAVRAGWDNSQIASSVTLVNNRAATLTSEHYADHHFGYYRSMLYHIITRNPHKDITLHVSITNPAMILYNRFGFKAEEFIVGFYEDYLDPNSPQSKNAFRLRLRR